MILTIAFAQGFKYAIAGKMYAFSGHIRVQHFESDKTDSAELSPVTQNDTVISILKSDPAVESVHAYANKDAILKGPAGGSISPTVVIVMKSIYRPIRPIN